MVGQDHGGLYKAPTIKGNERLRGEGDKMQFIDLIFERGQVVRCSNTRKEKKQ